MWCNGECAGLGMEKPGFKFTFHFEAHWVTLGQLLSPSLNHLKELLWGYSVGCDHICSSGLLGGKAG